MADLDSSLTDLEIDPHPSKSHPPTHNHSPSFLPTTSKMAAVPDAKANEVLLKMQEAIKNGLNDKALADAVKSVSSR